MEPEPINKQQIGGALSVITLLLLGAHGPVTAAEETGRLIEAAPGKAANAGLAETERQLTEAQDTREDASDYQGAVEITEEQNGGLVALGINDRLRVVIDGNPTTGYRWELRDLDPSLLRQIGEPTFSPFSNLQGSGGNFTFTFMALKVGTTHLRLSYRRPFEKGVPPARRYDVRVKIQ